MQCRLQYYFFFLQPHLPLTLYMFLNIFLLSLPLFLDQDSDPYGRSRIGEGYRA